MQIVSLSQYPKKWSFFFSLSLSLCLSIIFFLSLPVFFSFCLSLPCNSVNQQWSRKKQKKKQKIYYWNFIEKTLSNLCVCTFRFISFVLQKKTIILFILLSFFFFGSKFFGNWAMPFQEKKTNEQKKKKLKIQLFGSKCFNGFQFSFFSVLSFECRQIIKLLCAQFIFFYFNFISTLLCLSSSTARWPVVVCCGFCESGQNQRERHNNRQQLKRLKANESKTNESNK
jgi:hypothetical protein